MLLKRVLIVLGVMLGVGLLLLVPVKYYRVLSVGTDAYEAHHVLYGDRTQSQVVKIENKVVGIGAILVDFRKSLDLRPVEVTVSAMDGRKLSEGEVKPEQLKDDEFAWTELTSSVSRDQGDVVVRFRVPIAQIDNATGLRFDKKSGHLAMGLVEEVTLIKRMVIWAQDYPERAEQFAQVLFWGLLAAGFLGIASSRRKVFRLDIFVWLLVVLVFVALFMRVPIARQIESVYGGDAFNYLIQSRAWLEGDNPFAEEFRRKAPLFPLLLLPSWLSLVDPLMWGRVVNITASVSAIILLPLLLVRLKVPRPLALGAGLLLAVNRNFWWESVHGLANTLYAALVLGAVYAFVLHRRKFGRYMVGVLVGLATLARWEGGAVGAVLLPAVWILHRLKFRTIIYTLWPALVLTMIPFVFWPITGEVGVRTMEDIAGDGGLGLAHSWGDFIVNLKGFELFLGRNWLLIEAVGEQVWSLGIGLGLGLLFGFLQRQKSLLGGYMVRFAPYLLPLLLLFAVVGGSSEAYKLTVMLLTAVIGIGLGASLVMKPKLVGPIWLMLLLQVVVVTTILPKSRYYLQLVPFLSAGIIFCIWSLSDWRRSQLSRIGAVLAVGVLSSFVYMDSSLAMSGMVSDYNEKSHNHTVVMKASNYLLGLEGNVAVVEESDLPARVYLTMERTRIFPIEWASNMEDVTDDEVYSWMQKNEIRYAVETTAQPVFSIIDRRPEDFEFMQKFGTRFASTEALVYKVKRKQ